MRPRRRWRDDGVFSESLTVPLILPSTINNKSSNVYQVNGDLFVANVQLTDSPITSGYNNREFILSLYSFDTNNNNITNYTFANASDNTFSYNFDTVVNVTDVLLIYNKKQDLFNVVIVMKDLNNNLFMHNLFLRISNSVISLVTDKFFYNTNANFTINFYDGNNVSNLVLNALSSYPLSSTTYGTITL